MSDGKSGGVEMTPPSFGLPGNLDTQISVAIETQRSAGENFQTPPALTLPDFKPLLNLISSITGWVAIPSAESSLEAFAGLGMAYMSGQFESVVHEYFNKPVDNSACIESGMAASSGGDSLRSQLNADYQGEHPVIFIKQLQLLRNRYTDGHAEEKAYSWSIPIVQSSGMGKSRMIQEVSRTMFVIPINLRGALPDGIPAYPPADHDVRDYFEAGAQETDHNIQARCAVFLTNLFLLVGNIIKTWEKHGPELALTWSHYLTNGESTEAVSPHRLNLYQEVVKRSKQELQRLSTNANLNTVIGKLKTECQNLTCIIVHGQPSQSRLENVFYVAFDEAQTLTKPRGNENAANFQKNHSIYSNLEGVLKHLRDAYVFFIFLSTNLPLHQLAPPIKNHPSSRYIKQDGRVLLTPWTELPFDVFAQQTVDSSEPITLEKISSIDFMVGFGRALWYTYYQAQVTEGPRVDRPNTFEMAENKLVPDGAELSEGFLAAIGVRIGLTFDASSTPARELESRMVEQHMRVALVAPSHREFMRTTAPSEPVLAEAAGRACVLKKHAPEALQRYFARGMLARGERQAVVGRLLLTLAHDDVKVPRATVSPLETQCHIPISLIDLLKALFHKNHHQCILDARPTGNPHGTPLQETFKDAYVHFSHFGVASDGEVLDVKNLYKCLARGMAPQTTAAQRDIDAVIPVHLGSTTSPISGETTTSVNLQFNNRDDPRPYFIDRSIIVPNKNVPSLSLILELGATRTERVSERGVGRSHEIVPPGACWDDKHYEIVAYGHDAETYAVIPEGEEALYSNIMAASELYTDYAHSKDKEMVGCLKRMMPNVGVEGLFWPKS